MSKAKQELIHKLKYELEMKLLDENLSKAEKINIQNLLDVKADSYSDKSFLGIYENDNPFWFWSVKLVVVLGSAICLIKIIYQLI